MIDREVLEKKIVPHHIYYGTNTMMRELRKAGEDENTEVGTYWVRLCDLYLDSCTSSEFEKQLMKEIRVQYELMVTSYSWIETTEKISDTRTTTDLVWNDELE